MSRRCDSGRLGEDSCCDNHVKMSPPNKHIPTVLKALQAAVREPSEEATLRHEQPVARFAACARSNGRKKGSMAIAREERSLKGGARVRAPRVCRGKKRKPVKPPLLLLLLRENPTAKGSAHQG